MILLDTSILIDFYRKTNKDSTYFLQLCNFYDLVFVSQITFFEVYIGANEEQNIFWQKVFNRLTVLDFVMKAANSAVELYKQLKTKNKLIETPDIFIAATALANNLPLATLNVKHFERIENLKLVTF